MQANLIQSLEIPATVCPVLRDILKFCRGHDSKGEKLFLEWLRKQLTELKASYRIGVEGTIIVEVGDYKDTMFACHVDTVNRNAELLEQRLLYDPNFGHITLDKSFPHGTCLGADDGVGVWICLKMIEAGIHGTYVFHRGEEVGAVSARRLVVDYRDWLKGFKRAVEFDRPRDDEVIATQGGTRCASNAFADALADELNRIEPNFSYKTSHQGVFTDVKIYSGVIPECVNIGVGYHHQHGTDEYLDFAHATALLNAVLLVDWAKLPTERDPAALPPAPSVIPGFYRAPAGYQRPMFAAFDDAPMEPEEPLDTEQDTAEWLLEASLTDIEMLADDKEETIEAIISLSLALTAERAKTARLRQLLEI